MSSSRNSADSVITYFVFTIESPQKTAVLVVLMVHESQPVLFYEINGLTEVITIHNTVNHSCNNIILVSIED